MSLSRPQWQTNAENSTQPVGSVLSNSLRGDGYKSACRVRFSLCQNTCPEWRNQLVTMSARVPPWLPIFPLPSLFIPPTTGVFNFPVKEESPKEEKCKFSIEKLLPEETKPAAATVLPLSLAPVLPAPSLEFVNGGYGVKNPLAGGSPAETSTSNTGEEGKFTCRICGKKFSLQRLLNRHSKCHSDLKRYLCTFCGKGFNDTFDLKRHTRTHTGVRPYKCDQCDKSFTQRCSLESHLRKVHGVQHTFGYKERRSKVFVCEECGFTSEIYEMYVNHLKLLHPFSAALMRPAIPPRKTQSLSPATCSPTPSTSS